MISARTRIALPLMLAVALAAGPLAPRAGAAGLPDVGGAEWLLEQPAAPLPPAGIEGTNFPIGLGRIGDIEFWAANRGALITAGNGSTIHPGVWVYNGDCEGASAPCANGWHELASECGASDGRIAWAGPDEFWTISDGRTGQASEALGRQPPLEDDTLCRFALNATTGELQIVDSYATLAFQSNSYPPMHAAACLSSTDCWFGGNALEEPQTGAFHLHWNGRTVTREPYLAEGHAVQGMSAFEGHLYESVQLKAGDRSFKKEGKAGEVPALHLINPEGVEPTFEPILDLPLLGPGEYPLALDFLRLSANEDALWAAAGPVTGGQKPEKSVTAGVTVLRYSKVQYSDESDEYVKEEVPSWAQIIGPCPFLASACEPEPPEGNPFPKEVVDSIAAEPGTNSAWIALDSMGDAEEPSPTTRASLARVSADGTISDELQLPGAGGEQYGPKGAAERIVCPGPHDCWMTTTQGWLFHLATAEEREHPQRNAELAFSGDYLITERPPDESVPQQPPVTIPINDSGEEAEAPKGEAHLKVAVAPPPFDTVEVPLLSDVHTRLVHGTTLDLSFRLSVKASVRLLAKRHATVVASTPKQTLRAGSHSLLLRLNVHRWPTKLDLQTHALAPPKTTSTLEVGGNSETVTTSLAFPNARGLPRSGLLGSGLLGSGLLP